MAKKKRGPDEDRLFIEEDWKEALKKVLTQPPSEVKPPPKQDKKLLNEDKD